MINPFPLFLCLLFLVVDGIPTTAFSSEIEKIYAREAKVFLHLGDHNSITSTTCLLLSDSFVSGWELYHCKVATADEAIDAGPFDSGRVLAWNKKEALFATSYIEKSDGSDSFQKIRFASASDINAYSQLKVLKMGDSGKGFSESLQTSFEQKMDAENWQATANRNQLPEWIKLLFQIQFHTNDVVWTSGVLDKKIISQNPQIELNQAHIKKASELGSSLKKGSFLGVVKVSHTMSEEYWFVYLTQDSKSQQKKFHKIQVATVQYQAG